MFFEPTPAIVARFWKYVDKSAGQDACWPWTGGINLYGYGHFWTGSTTIAAHRASCIIHGRIQGPGEVCDHVCRNPRCVNPTHIRFVPQSINSTENSESVYAKNAQKTHCKNGHPFAGDNLAIIRSAFKQPGKHGTSRACLTCFPQFWMYAVIEREPPPGAHGKWRGPYQPQTRT